MGFFNDLVFGICGLFEAASEFDLLQLNPFFSLSKVYVLKALLVTI